MLYSVKYCRQYFGFKIFLDCTSNENFHKLVSYQCLFWVQSIKIFYPTHCCHKFNIHIRKLQIIVSNFCLLNNFIQLINSNWWHKSPRTYTSIVFITFSYSFVLLPHKLFYFTTLIFIFNNVHHFCVLPVKLKTSFS